jgi:hypothetical protein
LNIQVYTESIQLCSNEVDGRVVIQSMRLMTPSASRGPLVALHHVRVDRCACKFSHARERGGKSVARRPHGNQSFFIMTDIVTLPVVPLPLPSDWKKDPSPGNSISRASPLCSASVSCLTALYILQHLLSVNSYLLDPRIWPMYGEPSTISLSKNMTNTSRRSRNDGGILSRKDMKRMTLVWVMRKRLKISYR